MVPGSALGTLMNDAEITTALTDFLLAASAAYGSYRLMQIARRNRQRSVAWWSVAFAVLSVSAVAGGIYHGVSFPPEDVWRTAIWKLTVYGIGAFNYKVLAGSAEASLASRPRASFHWANVAVFAAYAIWMLTHNDYRFVIYYSALAMVGVLALHLGYRSRSTRWMVGAVAVSALAAIMQYSGIDLHRRFDHNDLYHVVQIVGIYFFYRGACLLRDKKADAQA